MSRACIYACVRWRDGILKKKRGGGGDPRSHHLLFYFLFLLFRFFAFFFWWLVKAFYTERHRESIIIPCSSIDRGSFESLREGAIWFSFSLFILFLFITDSSFSSFFFRSAYIIRQQKDWVGGTPSGYLISGWFQIASLFFFFFFKEKEFPLLFFLPPPHSFICIYSFLDPLLFSHLCLFRRSRRPPHLISLSWFIFILYFLFPPFFFLDYS